MKSTFKLFFALFILTTISCENDNELTSSQLTSEDALVNSKIDIASDDISSIADQLFDNVNSNTINYRNSNTENSVFSNCATITRVPAFGTDLTPGTQVTKTIDFGTTGCTLNNGNIVKGKIIISFVFEPNASSHTITRELVEGYGTLTFADNVYRITGNWTTTNQNGSQHTATITEPLMAKMSCTAVNKPILTKGIITFVKNNVTSTLDYGEGECDNIAIYSINGNSYTINIGN
jgi:hypothetical protein